MDKVTEWMSSGWNSSQHECGGSMLKHILEQELCIVKKEEGNLF